MTEKTTASPEQIAALIAALTPELRAAVREAAKPPRGRLLRVEVTVIEGYSLKGLDLAEARGSYGVGPFVLTGLGVQVREALIAIDDGAAVPVVCGTCGDHADTAPGSPCGRTVGPPGEDDDHPAATVCTGSYQPASDHLRDRLLIDRLRAYLGKNFRNSTPIGALFTPEPEGEGGTYLTSDGRVLFEGGSVDFAFYDGSTLGDLLGEAWSHGWPDLGRTGAVAVDLRGEGTVTFTQHDDRDIYTWFDVPRPR